MSNSPVGLVATSLMVARPRELLKELQEGTKTVQTLKTIKNQVIGNKFKKSVFVSEGAVELVLEILKDAVVSSSSEDHVEVVQQQAAIVIGSLSLTDAGLRRLISHEGLPVLVQMLNSSEDTVVEAGLWAIKLAVQQSMGVPSSSLPSPLDGHASALDPSACTSASGPAVSAVPAATTAAAAAAPFSSMTLVRLDAAAMSAVVRCLAAGTTPANNCSTSGTCGVLVASSRSGRGAAIAALAAAVVACCSRREEERDLAVAAGAAEGLLSLLLDSKRPDTQAAALEGLSLLLPFEPSACALALACPAIYSRMLTLLRDPAPEVRLLAASCVATLSRIPGCDQSEAMQRAALPVLLRLLAQTSTRPQVPAVLARLIEGSEALQKAAADADTVRLLAGLLAAEATAAAMTPAPASTVGLTAQAPTSAVATPAPSGASARGGGIGGDASVVCSASSRLREGCLRALGSLCLNRDDSRKQLLEAKVLRHIVRALEDPSSGVRAAAALCVRALSRCVRTLRGGLLEGGGGGELAPLLVALLGDEEPDVQSSAAAAVCNLVLDFSAAKSAVLAAGGLGRLVELTSSAATPLRHHATWALANLLYRADNGVRVQLTQALPWSRMRQLLSDREPGVVEQALVILRNLCMGDRHHIAATLVWADGGAAGAAAAPAGMCSSILQISHPVHGLGHGHGQLQGTGAHKSEEGLLDVLQARIQAAAAMSSAAAEPVPAVSESESQSESYGGAMVSSPSLTAGSPTPSQDSQAGIDGDGGSSSSPPPPPPSHTVTHATHALYAVANLLTGGPSVKNLVAARRSLLAAVAAHLRPTAGELALPAVWCAVNLTWPASSSASGGGGGGGIDREGRTEQDAVTARCRALLEVRGAELLEELGRKHPSRDVQERARTALEQLKIGAGLMTAGAPAGSVSAAAAAAAIMGSLIVI